MSWATRGACSAVALVLVAINYFVMEDHCGTLKNVTDQIEKAQYLHILAGGLAAASIALHVLMLRGCLKNPICRIVTAGFQLAVAAACIGAAFFVFNNPCNVFKASENLLRNFAGQKSNIFTVEDGKNIMIFIVDLVAAVIVGGSTFLRPS